MSRLTAGAPLETATRPVGRRTVHFVDATRDQRALTADVWYPAAASSAERTSYELFPGVSFEAATAQHEPPVAAGRYPLVLLSHGRTGMRISYSMVCEALAARGAVVVSADHPGDALLDWMLGQHADDRLHRRVSLHPERTCCRGERGVGTVGVPGQHDLLGVDGGA